MTERQFFAKRRREVRKKWNFPFFLAPLAAAILTR
jgi:hypothetical protein